MAMVTRADLRHEDNAISQLDIKSQCAAGTMEHGKTFSVCSTSP